MKASAEQEDRKFPPPRSGRNIQAETLGDWGPAEPPHPASRAALAQRLQQETAARELAEALHAKKAAQLEEATKRIGRLEALIVGLHLEQGPDSGVHDGPHGAGAGGAEDPRVRGRSVPRRVVPRKTERPGIVAGPSAFGGSPPPPA